VYLPELDGGNDTPVGMGCQEKTPQDAREPFWGWMVRRPGFPSVRTIHANSARLLAKTTNSKSHHNTPPKPLGQKGKFWNE
jgi:hypothetical protein